MWGSRQSALRILYVLQARRKLAEVQGPTRGLKQANPFDNIAVYGPPVVLSEAIVVNVGVYVSTGTTSGNTTAGRRLLQGSPPSLTFVGE